jgi:hypothetical protein
VNSHSTSASSLHAMNAQVVLDQTRRELREYLMGEPVESTTNYPGSATKKDAAGVTSKTRQHQAKGPDGNVHGIDWMGLVKAGAATWWRDHPLHVGATVLKPVVTDYVRRKPIATLAFATAAGAAFVLIRPWRIASVTALGMSLVRSSNLPVMAASLVATVAENLQKEHS